jgi:hypothetical protein
MYLIMLICDMWHELDYLNFSHLEKNQLFTSLFGQNSG